MEIVTEVDNSIVGTITMAVTSIGAMMAVAAVVVAAVAVEAVVAAAETAA